MESRITESKIRQIANKYLNFYHVSKHSYHPIATNNHLINFLSGVEFAYLSIAAPYQQIINNDFFYQEYPGWWKSRYKKTNYLKLRKLAVRKFLEVFYEYYN